MYDEEAPCQIYRGESLAFSSSQQIPANCSPQHLGYATSVAIPEPARESSHSTKGKSKMVDDPSDKSSEQDMCVSNINPTYFRTLFSGSAAKIRNYFLAIIPLYD
jgi:hypothetical protein